MVESALLDELDRLFGDQQQVREGEQRHQVRDAPVLALDDGFEQVTRGSGELVLGLEPGENHLE